MAYHEQEDDNIEFDLYEKIGRLITELKDMKKQQQGQSEQYSPKFKFQVAMEAIKGEKTEDQLADEFGVKPWQISAWKSSLLVDGVRLFEEKAAYYEQEDARTESELYEQLGRLVSVLDYWNTQSRRYIGG